MILSKLQVKDISVVLSSSPSWVGSVLIQCVPPVSSDLVHQTVVHLVLLHEDVSLQYFIPAVA